MIRVENPVVGGGKGNGYIPELLVDPVPLVAEQSWVLKTGGGSSVSSGGALMGILGLATYMVSVGTHTAGGALSYQFSYRTLEGTTKRVTIS
jgi:hypothetical protein